MLAAASRTLSQILQAYNIVRRVNPAVLVNVAMNCPGIARHDDAWPSLLLHLLQTCWCLNQTSFQFLVIGGNMRCAHHNRAERHVAEKHASSCASNCCGGEQWQSGLQL